MASTSMESPLPGKRKSDVADNIQTKKQKWCADSMTTESLDSEKKVVKDIMQRVRSKLDKMPPKGLTDFLRDRIKMLEEDRKEIVGVFGKTGSGKSSLINTILGVNLLPSGAQGSCTSVMIQVEANMTNDQYIAEIEFITFKEWKDELLFIFMNRSCEEGGDEEQESNDDDVEKITALYGIDGWEKTIEELMDKKYFRRIPDFITSGKQTIFCNTAEELSEKITSFTRSNTQSDTFKQQYWPLVKCITIKVPNSNDLLEHVVLVDLPGNGDCNKSRDEKWKSFVGKCSAVWVVSDIARATSEKEPWEIMDSTVRLLGPGGECRSISFICTKTDNIGDVQKDDAHTWILTRNETTKMKVNDKFKKNKHVKKHFSCGEDFIQVFTVSSKEYKNKTYLEKKETEIPHLQEFLRNLNDHHTRTSDYIFGAHGILSLIQGAKSSDMANSKEEVQKILELRLEDELESIGEYMEKPYMQFDQQLSKGVEKSEETCKQLLNQVIEPRMQKGRGFHKILKSLCENDGIYKPKGKEKREININESLASTMRSCTDEVFTYFFPNDISGPIKTEIDTFTLNTDSLVKEHQSMSLHLIFLKTEERKLKAELIHDLLEKKKQIYYSLSESIKESMQISYTRAALEKGEGSLKRMKEELHQHVKNENIFQKAKDDMLNQLTKLKDHIVMQLKCKLQESINVSLKTHKSSFLPDITEEYNQIRMLWSKFNNVPFTPTLDSPSNPSAFQTQSVQMQTSVPTQYICKPTYRQQCPQAGLFHCGLTGLMFEMAGMGEVVYKMKQWDTDLLGSMTPAGPLFSINCPAVQQLHLPHCMCDEKVDTLLVAHIMLGKVEILKPVKTTFTHVVVDIPHNSLVGLIKHGYSSFPVQSQVLLFLQPPENRTQKATKLNVFLLPKNVPICEVKHQQKGSIFIQTSSECTLNPTGEYGLTYQLVTKKPIDLTNGHFEADYSPDVQPTFQVYLDCISDVENMSLTLLDRKCNDQKVWEWVVQTDSTVQLENPLMRSSNKCKPEIYNQKNSREYRFQCLSAGLFQCSKTGLGFRMVGEVDVIYNTVPWDRKLLDQSGKRPAGPLFKFTCNKGSVCELQLPHCEIYSEGGCDFLSVAHVTDDGSITFIHPDQTTETHVILNIAGFCKFGLTKDTNAPVSSIRALVLPFYQLPDVNKESTMNVLLLPKNVDIDEVCEKRKKRHGEREKFIEIPSSCELTPDQEYTLSTNLPEEQHEIDPAEKAKFVDYEYYTNYLPTFQLHLKTDVKKLNLLLKQHDGPETWKRSVPLPASTTEIPSTAPLLNSPNPLGKAFITKHRSELVNRLGLLRPIVLRLTDSGVMSYEEGEEVESKSTNTLKRQTLLDLLMKKGNEAQENFYSALKVADPCLVRHLEGNA
ncbi:hypothetical protein UPYG_G00107530 [Umbra pygmaea]|uniref:FIIND domain-containing protein n=1 Tax=Umbra pygmaea TaxID=75934 RepID=A0ABD0XMG6_UMBPY